MKEQENRFSSFKIWVSYLFSKWKLFVLVGLVAGAAGVLDSTLKAPQYESKLTFALDAGTNMGGLSSAMDLAAQFGLGLGSGQGMFDGDNILEIMKSRRMIEDVFLSVDTFNNKPYTLIEYYLKISGKAKRLNVEVHFPIGCSKPSLSYIQDSILYVTYKDFADNNLTASRPDRKLSIYEVRVLSPDEKFTKDFTDRIVNETNSFYTEISGKKDKETLDILEQRVAFMKDQIGISVDARASSKDANVNTAFVKGQSSSLKQQYNMEAYGEAYKEMFKTLELARYQYLKRLPLLQIIDHADYPMKRIRLGKLTAALIFSTLAVLLTFLLLYISFLFKGPVNSKAG